MVWFSQFIRIENAMPTHAQEIHLIQRPAGAPSAALFALKETPLPKLQSGQILVENLYLSVDPYMRECMDEEWELGAPLEGRSVGRVIDAGDSGLDVGQLVFHREGWRSHAIVPAAEARILKEYSGVSASAFLSLLGGTGLTAYVALTRIAKLQAGEDLFVSAAAGGVGSAVAQFARLMGARRLIGSTSSADKARYLTETLAYDAAINYREQDLAQALAGAAPDGFDIYIDNVGGKHLEVAIRSIREHGRIAWVGAVGQYNNPEQAELPRNLYDIVGKSLRLEGFLVRNYRQLQDELESFAVPQLQSGRLQAQETLAHGLENMPQAFVDMLTGRSQGKMIIKL
ncbi:NADP-dependent oxidoreductase [Chromobacterium sp. IIBBL 290-4]|uniref:NADP-dependent oxidoreductase n=1 Tax=Chromobacterium sp. IIBBL 290-4 TaxID=2953890 RepID=UPI0020B7319B|nr:NADP-dependent oxidoreductase [Chromobacterium sp. IIBBL 290-4]UTH73616.1 NADP-dependent oxidoreductase [Chromobacterium sp. IIBBL 290-4]